MSATIKGSTVMVFGCDTVTSVTMQTTDSSGTGEVTEVTDEQNSVIAFAMSHGERVDVSGTYIYKGADITTLATAITLANAYGSGGIYVYSMGRKAGHNAFLTGDFKAIRVSGIS
jgi:hypothetical protein